MIILHYIPSMDAQSGPAPDYVNCLVRATRNVAESHVITDNDLGDNVVTAQSRLSKFFKELAPDILHIHAAWSSKAAMVEWAAKRKGVFTVLSVHGGLAPEIIDLNFWKEKLPRLMSYQFQMVRKSHALVAVSKDDYEQLKALGWKKRIVCIPHPMLFSTTDEETCEAIMGIYRKIIDTYYLLRITEPEVEFVKKCAAIKLWHANRDFDITTSTTRADEAIGKLTQEVQQLPILSFKRVYLYAHDNNITDLLTEGARLAGITMPPKPDMESLPRFKPKSRKDKNARNYKILCKVISDSIEGVSIEPEFTPSGAIAFRTICDIFRSLRFHNFDEDKFLEMLEKAKVANFCRKTLTSLHSVFDLEPGYMPAEMD